MVSTRSTASSPGNHKLANEPVSRPPKKRRALNDNASLRQPLTLKRPSPPRRTRKQPVALPSPNSVPSPATESPANSDNGNADADDANTEDVDAEDVEADTEDMNTEEIDTLLDRIRSGIAYTQKQHFLNKPIMQTTRFRIDTSNASSHTAFTLLCRHATPIASAPSFELFELGIPRPELVMEGVLSGLHDPQWWVGKSPAEIKAGPFAEEADVRRAAAYLKGLETKKGKKKWLTGREKDNAWKLSAATESQKEQGDRRGEDQGEGEGEGENDNEVEGEIGGSST